MKEGQTIQWPKGRTMIYKKLLGKLTVEQLMPTKTSDELRCSRSVSRFNSSKIYHNVGTVLKYTTL
jgi:hypothetical protein